MWDKIKAWHFDPISDQEFYTTFSVRHGTPMARVWEQAKKNMYSAYEIPHVDCWEYVAQGVDK